MSHYLLKTEPPESGTYAGTHYGCAWTAFGMEVPDRTILLAEINRLSAILESVGIDPRTSDGGPEPWLKA